MKVIGASSRGATKHYETYKSWREHYFVDYGVNIADIMYAGVVNGKFIQVSLGALYELGDDNEWLANKLRRITCKHIYSGTNPRMEILDQIDDQLRIDIPLGNQLQSVSLI